MNLPRFIAQRIHKTNTTTFTSTVTKIGISSIAIGLAVMIISFSILIGFKKTIQEKLFSLSSHIQVSKITLNQSFEETPIAINTKFYQNYRKIKVVFLLQGKLSSLNNRSGKLFHLKVTILLN